MPQTYVVIPARYQSSRFPGKPLADLCGKPMIAHVIAAVPKQAFAAVIVATDHEGIAAAARQAGAAVVMTSPDHLTGTDRLAEVAVKQDWQPEDCVINLQGDEPTVPGKWLTTVAGLLEKDSAADMATIAFVQDNPQIAQDPNRVKVVRNQLGRAMYFSRAQIPYPRDGAGTGHSYLQHVGIYGYRVANLLKLSQAAPAPMEIAESLEQLRALHLGLNIAVGIVDPHEGPGGVDTPEDLATVAKWLKAKTTNEPT